MTTKEFYTDKFDESKRLSEGDNRHRVELYRKRFLYRMLIDQYKPKTILQIACGTGIHTEWLCETFGDIEVTATDLLHEHIAKIKDYKNLVHKLAWDCNTEIPNELLGNKYDLVLVEGAWYHTEDRIQLVRNIKALAGGIVVIDWLSAWHDATQRLLQDKKMPNNWKCPRPAEPFVFETESSLNKLLDVFQPPKYKVQLFPVDLDTRFGYKDLNEVDEEQFIKFIDRMNWNIGLYDANQSFILNATEHGCYVISVYNTL